MKIYSCDFCNTVDPKVGTLSISFIAENTDHHLDICKKCSDRLRKIAFEKAFAMPR